MIEIKVNDEIRDVRAEFLIGLTIRQMMWCGLGLALCGGLGIALYFFTPLPLVLITYLVFFLMLPFGAMAFLSWHEMDMLTAAKLYITRNLLDPLMKTYGSPNQAYLEYQELIREKEKKNKNQRFAPGKKMHKEVDPVILGTMGSSKAFTITDPKNERLDPEKEEADGN